MDWRKSYSLKAFLVVFCVLTIFIGIISHRVHRRSQVIQSIVSSGGQVDFDYEMKIDGYDWFDDQQSPPSLLVYFFGRDAVATVGYVRLNDMDTDLQKGSVPIIIKS